MYRHVLCSCVNYTLNDNILNCNKCGQPVADLRTREERQVEFRVTIGGIEFKAPAVSSAG